MNLSFSMLAKVVKNQVLQEMAIASTNANGERCLWQPT